MNKGSVLAIALIFLMSLGVLPFATVKAQSTTIVVPDNYPSIQDAINNANAGDTIYIKTGTYVENPVVNKSVSLIGENRDRTIIDVTAGLR